MTDPKRWLDEGGSSPLGALARAGATERPSTSAKHRARAAVLLATAGGAASAAATKAAVASTAASTSAPPVSLAASTTAASGAAGSSAAVATGTAGAVVTGAAGLSAKFGASAVILGIAAKWTGVSAMVAAVGFGGYQLASSSGAGARLTDASQSTGAATGVVLETLQLPNMAGTAPSADVKTTASQDEHAPASRALQPVALELPPGVATPPVAALDPAEFRSIVSPPERRAASPESVTPPKQEAATTSDLPTSLARNQELALVDRAWTALRSGKPREALRLIDGYAWTASDRQFEAEALIIRLEALGQSGQNSAARALASKILQRHQRGSLADKARKVLGDSASTLP